MRLFFSWQSDLSDERNFIRKCLEEVCEELDIEYDEDTRDSGAAEFVADVLLRKIKNSDIFVADLTPVGVTPTGKKLTNPNVCFETGFAERHHGRSQIVLTYNEEKAEFNDLPFDLSKRVSVRFQLSKISDATHVNSYKSLLKKAIGSAARQPLAQVVSTTLNKSEKTILYWARHAGRGMINEGPYGSSYNPSLGLGDGFLGAKQALYESYDRRSDALYRKALTSLSDKDLLAFSQQNMGGLRSKRVWVLTEAGDSIATNIGLEEVYGLPTAKNQKVK